jgi:hypothetical protein
VSIPWQDSEAVGTPIVHHLLAEIEPHVNVGFRIDEDGDYIVSFVVGISGKHRTLGEVEDFIRRCAALLEDEPVVP